MRKLEEAEKRYKAAPETVTKMIRFREKFTFLNSPDCPDILKILVSDMFTAYGKYKEAFARLEVTPDDVSSLSTAQEAQAVVENFITNREMWDELEYYRENGKILGKCEKVKSLSVRKGVENLSDKGYQILQLQEKNKASFYFEITVNSFPLSPFDPDFYLLPYNEKFFEYIHCYICVKILNICFQILFLFDLLRV